MNMLWDSTASALFEITECASNGITEVWILPPHETDHVSNKEMSNMLKLEFWGFQQNYYQNGRESKTCVPINDRLPCDNGERRRGCKARQALLCKGWTANTRGKRWRIRKREGRITNEKEREEQRCTVARGQEGKSWEEVCKRGKVMGETKRGGRDKG